MLELLLPQFSAVVEQQLQEYLKNIDAKLAS